MVMFENLADKFDNNSTDINLDVKKFASDLYEDVNGKKP
jgi:hypothetical protein